MVVVVVASYPAKKQINIDIFPLVGYLGRERREEGGGRGASWVAERSGGGVRRASRGEGVARFPPPTPNWKNGNNKSRLLGGLHGGLARRGCSGVQRNGGGGWWW